MGRRAAGTGRSALARHRRGTPSEITVQTFKVGTAEKKTLLSVFSCRLAYYYFFLLYISCISLSSAVPPPPPCRPAIPTSRPALRIVYPGPRATLRVHAARRQYFGKTRRPNTTPEWLCDGMFGFRYAAFQCENFSLSHSAAFAATTAAVAVKNGSTGLMS